MESIVFTCEVITPMFLAGADGQTPELRAPSIKGALRFWWRALHGHLPLNDLREQEAKIFGSTKGRSKVIIRVEENIEKEIISSYLLPHKPTEREKSPAKAFKEGLPFKIKIDFDKNKISREKIQNLFVLACTLGGWGKRSRRGFGSVMVTEIDEQAYSSPMNIDRIKELIDKTVPNKFRKDNSLNEIVTNHSSTSARGEYPEILKIQIGKTVKSLEDIGQVTHDTKFIVDTSQNKQDYSKSLGDGRPRLASPVYVSFLENGLPVITTLNKESWVNVTLQNELKSRIL